MKLKKQLILICLLAVIEIPFNALFPQNIQTKPTRQSSFEAFSKGEFEKAYAQFRELLLTYTKDPLYKYYSGVCLVKLNKEPGEAIALLKEALKGGDAVKTLPSDGLFYLGRAQQMSGKFQEAVESYKLYTERTGKKTAKEMGVPELLQECRQKKGQIADSELKPVAKLNIDKADTSQIGGRSLFKEPVQKNNEKSADLKENLPADYEKTLNEAIEYQFKADSLLELAGEQRKEMEKLSNTEKSALKARISENEKLAASFQNIADQKYNQAKGLINPQADTNKLKTVAPVKTLVGHEKDSALAADLKTVKIYEKQSDTTKGNLMVARPKMEIFALFEAMPKTLSDAKGKVVIDPEVPEGLIYRIQIAVFRNPVDAAYFKGLIPVYGFKIEGTDKTIYYAGMFRKAADAGKALSTVKNKGFKDAFIVALSDNKRISNDRAVLLEKEWGKKPFYSIEKTVSETQADTITRTLTFRVEVTRSLKPLNIDIVEEIRKMAGNRGLDIQLLEDGKISYLVGKFITFETASEYADLLNRNGYREAKVVAKLGEKEIPVETARQLFEKLK
ncbi:MAG: SPOR domain-containing protein [Bacteroidales bacterium]